MPNNKLDNQADNQPHNSNTSSASKQEITVKDNSSASGILQVAGSINYSTININVHNNDTTSSIPHTNTNQTTHNLPERNHFFTGRDDILNELSNLFKSNKGAAFKQAISGMGGIGKTQTAIEFCHRHINHYNFIFWVKSENETDFNNSYWELAKLLKLISDKDTKEGLKIEHVVALVKHWLSTNSNWLIVLDNLDDYEALNKAGLINHFLPSNHLGHTLITTRDYNLGRFAKTTNLEKMDSSTGSLFLLRRCEWLTEIDLLDKASEENNKLAQEIVEEMDGLPLALDQAGAYILHSKSTLAKYLSLYKDVKQAAKLRDKRGKNTDNHISVTATFQLAFDKLKRKSPIAADVLKVCSFLSPDSIPEEIFTKAGHLLGDELNILVDDGLAWDEVVELLLSYSLIERDSNNNSLSIHRLVQQVSRDLLDSDTTHAWIKNLIKALNLLSPDDPNNPITWKYYQRLLPSVLQLLSTLSSKPLLPDPLESRPFEQMGLYCYTQALYPQALEFYHKALSIKKFIYGDGDINVSSTLNGIANVYYAQGKYNDALDLYQQALSIKKLVLGKDHPSISPILNNIAEIYRALGMYSDALRLYKQTLSISKRYFGDNHPEIAKTLNNIASVFLDQAKYDDALDLYQQALSISKHYFGDNHPEVAKILNNIGIVCGRQKKYDDALDCHQQSLSIKKSILENSHPDIAYTLHNIASIYRAQAKYNDALDYFNQALAITKIKLGNNHPHIADALNSIGLIYYDQEKYDEALHQHNQALAIYELTLGDNHPFIADTLNNIAGVYDAQKKYDEALSFYKKALSIYKSKLGDNHPSTAKTLNNIANVYSIQKKYDEALELYQQALSIKSGNSFSTSETLNNMGQVYASQEKYEEAFKFFKRALETLEGLPERNHPKAGLILVHIGHLYLLGSNVKVDRINYNEDLAIEALACYKEALSIYDRFLDTNHSRTIELLRVYSALLTDLNRKEEAQILLDRLAALGL